MWFVNRIANRIQKVLEDANIKLASLATDALGASGRAILEAMLSGEQDVAQLAEMSKGLLRNKIPELKLALEGRVTEHHRFLLQQLYDHLLFTESKRKQIEEEIERRMGPFRDEVVRLCTIPGVDRVTAWGMLAEIGLNMDQFPSAAHLASWACLCPGSFESAGKRLSGKMTQGQCLAPPLSVAGGLVHLDDEEQLPLRAVSAHCCPAGSQARSWR